MMPMISTKNQGSVKALPFDKQISRDKYQKAFVSKQEEHKIALGTYDANYKLVDQRSTAALLQTPDNQRRVTISKTQRSLSPDRASTESPNSP